MGNNILFVGSSALAGGVKIGNNVFIGIGSLVKNQCVVGNNVTIGMGSVVIYDVEDNETVAGVPAKVLKKH